MLACWHVDNYANTNVTTCLVIKGVIAAGYASDALDEQVQENIVKAYAGAHLSLPLRT
jgi:hypothetical protein